MLNLQSPDDRLPAWADRNLCCHQILTTLHGMGRELPHSSISMLRWAAQAKVDVRIISDCNSTFINAMLVGTHPLGYMTLQRARNGGQYTL